MGELCVGDSRHDTTNWKMQASDILSSYLLVCVLHSMIIRWDTVGIDNLIILMAASISAPSRVRVLRIVVPLDRTHPHTILIP